jgi:hypothetical protein
MRLKKKLALTLCIVASVCAIVATSVFTTVAFLTGSASITNTFTIGSVGITLTESKVNMYGVKEDGAERVTGNQYKLVPSQTYVKDPVLTVSQGSEESYLFVIVNNEIAAIECKHSGEHGHNGTIETQLNANGWYYYTTANTGKVYVYAGNAATAAVSLEGKATGATAGVAGDYPLFGTFSVDPLADLTVYEGAQINITAIAIQASGFVLDTAWDQVVTSFPFINDVNN